MKVFDFIVKKLRSYRAHRVSSHTVKYMFPAFLGALVLLGAATITGVKGTYVYLQTTQRTVEAGAVFSVQVGVSASTPVNAVDILIDFPSDKVEVFSVDRGKSVITLWTQDPAITKSSVRFVGGTFKRGFIGNHEIATIKFRAKNSGQYSIRTKQVTFVAGDGTGNEVAPILHQNNELTLFNFDENTTEEQMRVAVSSGIVTDINGDGKVTLQDISAFMAAWNSRSSVLDFNNDGRMTFTDFSIILADFFLR